MTTMNFDAMNKMLYNFIGYFITEGEIVFEYGTDCFGFQNLQKRNVRKETNNYTMAMDIF